MLIYLTSMGQNTIQWSAELAVHNNPMYGNNFPRIELGKQGRPVVLWGDGSDIFLARWIDTSFNEPFQINPNDVDAAAENWMGPDLAVKGDTIYVVYKQVPAADTNNHVWLRSSFDGGVNFSAPVQVDYIGAKISRFPTVAIRADGHPVVGFMEFSNGWEDAQWVVASSNDFGASFGVPVLASGWSSNGAEACDCCPSKITTAGSRVVMPYRDNNNNIRDIWVGVSSDSGKSFTSGFAVDTFQWTIPGCPSSGPDGTIVGDTLYTTFMSSAQGRGYVYLSKTDLNVGGKPQIIELDRTSPNRLVSQNFPRLAYDDRSLAIAWKQIANSRQQIAIQFTQDIHTGINATQEIVTEGYVQGLDVAMDMGKIWIVWEDDVAKTVRYMFGDYQSNLSFLRPALPELNLFPNPAQDAFELKLPAHITAFRVNLLDMHGRLVRTFSPITSSTTLNIEDIPAGMYLVQVKTDLGTYQQKLIKQ